MPLVLDGDTGIVGVLLTDANGNVTFDTNTLYVDAPNNRVGIGTTVPDGKLTVALENSNTPAFRLSSPTSGTDFAISSYNDANGTYVSMGVNHLFNVSGNDAVMDTNDKSAAIVLDGRNNGRIQFLTNSSGIATPRMTILQDGKVGINNTTPPVKLSVGKTITAYEDSIAITGINSNADIMAGIGFDQSIDTLIIRNDQSFPAGGIAFRPANGTTTKMFIRQDGYVSIGGTHAPVETLDLRFSGRHGIICGSTSGSGSYIVLDGAGNGDAAGSDYAYIEHTSSGNLNFNVGNGSNSTNTKMLIEPGGNVGIGTSNPTSKLHVHGDTSNTFSALMLRNRGQVAGSAVKAIWSLNRDGSDVDFEAGSITVGKQQNWTTTPSTVDSYMAFSLTGNESIFETMRLDSDGGARLNSTSQVRFTLGNEGTPGTNTANWIRGSGGQLGLNAAHDNIHFEIGGSPKMLLNSSGLQLPGNYQYNAVDGFAFYYPSGRMQLGFNYNAFGAEIILGNNRTASGETAFMQYRTNGVTEGTLVGNGSGFSITNVSDYRKKENINELPNGSLARVVNVRPVTYTLKEEYTNDTSKIYTGFIAHEFQEQFPNSVRGVKDELNEDGTPKLQSIDITSNELLTHLIKSIQELKTENDALKARLDSAGL